MAHLGPITSLASALIRADAMTQGQEKLVLLKMYILITYVSHRLPSKSMEF